tara:strand:- start:740 stop:1060 length:321 start_codon:yes stop_codon:yes gene_type:complete
MSHMILSHLQAHDGATLSELCAATGLPEEAVQDILCELSRSGVVVGVPRNHQPPILHAVTTLGECEWCGIIEHHRVAGMCPTCLNKSSGLESLPATYTHATPRSHA